MTEYLGVPRFRSTEAEEPNEIGIATGLAWTEVGGEILVTEATLMPGKGTLTLTGKLGDVMQESAQAALSYVRSKAEEFGIPKDFNRKTDVHIHVPEGAIPKDGPSAGITLATALVSALTRIAVRRDVAMTGEITLRGKVLPIGGVKEKVLAAHRAGVKNIILPKDNEKDLADIPKNVLDALNVYLVETMDEVLKMRWPSRCPGACRRRRPRPSRSTRATTRSRTEASDQLATSSIDAPLSVAASTAEFVRSAAGPEGFAERRPAGDRVRRPLERRQVQPDQRARRPDAGAHERDARQDPAGELLSGDGRLARRRSTSWTCRATATRAAVTVRARRSRQLTAAYFALRGQGTGRDAAAGRGRSARPALVDARHPGPRQRSSALARLAGSGSAGQPRVVATKIDKLTRAERTRAQRDLESAFDDPVLPVSAVTGEGLEELWKLIDGLRSCSGAASAASKSRRPAPRSRRIDLSTLKDMSVSARSRSSPSSSKCRARPACASRS